MVQGSFSDQLEKSDLLYETLKVRHDEVLERRKVLTGQASSLLTFGGIINTILVGLLTSLTTNPNARTLLLQNSNLTNIVSLIEAGFAAFIVTVVIALMAFFEPKVDPAPVPLLGATPSEQKQKLMKIYADPAEFSVSDLEIQLINATFLNRKTNTRKARLLFAGNAFLLIGIIATALAGYLLISGLPSG
jgi:hypothetical protein